MSMRIDGGCHCGAIGYAATIDHARVSICHCTDCQTLTGSPFRVTVLCDRDAIRMSGNAPAIYVKAGDSGRKRRMYFWKECGTPLFASSADGNGEWGIRRGSIRQRALLAPKRQIWCESAVPWIDDVASLPGGAVHKLLLARARRKTLQRGTRAVSSAG